MPALDQATVEVVDDGHGANGNDGTGTGLIGLETCARPAGA
ncbi:MAG TPA: hypothetical protein VFY32_01670 [Solirubrobacteraceae bacterium]|nr:hypothetical protein [Solirubrobacteraceae bacterium]